MRKLIVTVTLLYLTLALAGLWLLSGGFRDVAFLTGSAIGITLVAGIPAALIVAIVAYRQYNEWLVLVLLAIVIGSLGFVAKKHHDAFGSWLPSLPAGEVVSSGDATLSAHGGTVRYRLELHDAGGVSHREYLVVSRGGKERKIRLPLFDEARSGYIGPKTPADWIVLKATDHADVYRVETGRFLLTKKSFRVNLKSGEVTTLTAAP
ncbi:MAG: hypothetical protein AABZ50_09250 [Pseudomonadota bacterium]